MKFNLITGAALSGLAFFATSAGACEPILPFMQAVGGPAILTKSVIVLTLAVGLKSLLFALFQKQLTFAEGFFCMLAGNVLSTIAGVLAAMFVGVGPIAWAFGIPVAFLLCWVPASRAGRLWKCNTYVLAILMTVALLASCILFALSQQSASRKELLSFWVTKLVAVYLALSVSIALSTFWEEWTIWNLNKSAPETSFVRPALKANLWVLLCVMLYAAALMVPLRMQYRDYLVPQAWQNPRRSILVETIDLSPLNIIIHLEVI